MSYSPRPWIIAERIKEPGWQLPVQTVRAINDSLICEIPYPDQEDNPANALLIAAAPDLLEALEELVQLVTMGGELIPGQASKTWRKARFAINRAKGKE